MTRKVVIKSTPPSARIRHGDLDLNYYLRASSSRKIRRTPPNRRSINLVSLWPQWYHKPLPESQWSLFSKYSAYTVLAYASVIFFCSLAAWWPSINTETESEEKRRKAAKNSAEKAVDFTDIKSDTAKVTITSAILSTLPSWSPETGFVLPHCLKRQRESKKPCESTLSTEEAQRESGSPKRWGGNLNFLSNLPLLSSSWVSSVQLLSAQLYRGLSSQEEEYPETSNITNIPFVKTEVVVSSEKTPTTFQDKVEKVIISPTSSATADLESRVKVSDRIGSSTEGYWEENSPLINSKMPSQLQSLLMVPEICV